MLTEVQTAELRAVINNRDVPAVVATGARIVLWMAEGKRRKDVAVLAGVSLPTVDRRVDRYASNGLAGLDVATGQVTADCQPVRDGARFLAFLCKAVRPHAGKEIHVVLDNLSTHDTPDVRAWLAANPNVSFHFTPTGSSWLNQVVRHEVA